MQKSIFGLLVVSCTILFGCASNQYRDPAQSISKYTYINSFECTESSALIDKEDTEWSGLSGYVVGPTQTKFKGADNEKILRAFTSDGCSSSPDGLDDKYKNPAWVDCCVTHDTAYWLGGTEEEKAAADSQLEQCISGKGYPNVAKVYHLFVKQFGGPNSSFTFRWGYGWNYKRPYGPITPIEEEQVKNLYDTSDKLQTKNKLAQTVLLKSTCEYYDVGIKKLNADERAIYQYLNLKLTKNTNITWAKLAYFNLERKEYVVKIESCDQPIQFILTKHTSKIKEIKSSCL